MNKALTLLLMKKTKAHYYQQVWDVTCQIPSGRVSTYGAIADYLALGSARMVGWALRQSMGNGPIPAHRVVNRKGELTGRHHFPEPGMMQALLEAEDVVVENDCVVDFEKLFWHPAQLDE